MTEHGSEKRILVVGGDAAGMSAASQAKRRAPELEVTVVEQGRYISYAACGMPYMISGVIPDPDSLLVLKPEQAREKRGLDLRLGHRAMAVNLDRKTVTTRDLGSGSEFELPFDRLLIATGARPVVPPVPGVNLNGVLTLRDYQSGLDFMEFVGNRKPMAAGVVGAGPVGLEMAETLMSLGLRVTVLKRTSSALLGLAPELGELVQEELVLNGCVVLTNTPLDSIADDGNGSVASVVAGGETFDCDLVLLAAGIRPESGLAASAGLKLGSRGAISVNDRLETSDPNVYAAGDCAEQTHLVTGEKVFVSQALAANRMGRVAGANMVASLTGQKSSVSYQGTLGSTVAKIFDLEVGFTGLGPEEASRAGLDAVTSVIKSGSRAHYYPGSARLRVCLVAERGTGRLLGGQMVGREGVAKRVDVLAAALHANMTVDQISRMDLCYAPPFSPVWDPVLIAANVALKRL